MSAKVMYLCKMTAKYLKAAFSKAKHKREFKAKHKREFFKNYLVSSERLL